MIDTHAHLYAPQLAGSLDAVIERFRMRGGSYIINCAAEPSSCNEVLSQASEYKEVLPTVAIHPELAVPGTDIFEKCISDKWIDVQLEMIEKLLSSYDSIVAVGECGLDYFWLKHERLDNRQQYIGFQKRMLEGCVELALTHHLPLVLHCRDEFGDKQCEAEMLDLLVKKGAGQIKGVFHSYTGSLSYLEDILALGFYVSVNGIVTYKSADNVREIMLHIPDDRLLLETDAPFLVPEKQKSQGMSVCEPVFVDDVAEFVAKRRNIMVDRLWEIVDENAEKLFSLSRF